jgi:hypothetical protein
MRLVTCGGRVVLLKVSVLEEEPWLNSCQNIRTRQYPDRLQEYTLTVTSRQDIR